MIIRPNFRVVAIPNVNPRLFTFSRASEATYFNHQGKLFTAPVDTLRHQYDPSTGEYLGWLVEPTSVNKFGPDWVDAPLTTGLTNVTMPQVDPATVAGGGLWASPKKFWKMTETTANAQHYWTRADTTFTPGSAVTFNADVRPAGRDRVTLAVQGKEVAFDLLNRNVVSGQHVDYTHTNLDYLRDGWCRITATITVTAASVSADLKLTRTGIATPTSYTGDGSSGVYVSSFSAEPGTLETSRITGSAQTNLTRSEDLLSLAGNWNAIDEGTMFVECHYAAPRINANTTALSIGTSGANMVGLEYVATADNSILIQGGAVIPGGNTVLSVALASSPASWHMVRAALSISRERNQFIMAVNGTGAGPTGLVAAIPLSTFNQTWVGRRPPGGPFINAGPVAVRSVAFFPRALTLNDCQQITQVA